MAKSKTKKMNSDLEALNSAEENAGVEKTDATIAEAGTREARPKKEPLNLDSKSEGLEDFIKNSFNDYKKIGKASELEAEKTVIISKDGSVRVMVVDSVEGNDVTIKPAILSRDTETIAFDSIDEIYSLGSVGKTNIKGDYTSDLWKLVKAANLTTDKSCKIGIVLTDDESMKTSENGKKFQENIINFFKENHGIDVSVRYSKTAGKTSQRDGAGFAILAKNPDETVMTELFKAGSHHYNKRTLFELELEGDSDFKVVQEGDSELKEMIQEVVALNN